MNTGNIQKLVIQYKLSLELYMYVRFNLEVGIHMLKAGVTKYISIDLVILIYRSCKKEFHGLLGCHISFFFLYILSLKTFPCFLGK